MSQPTYAGCIIVLSQRENSNLRDQDENTSADCQKRADFKNKRHACVSRSHSLDNEPQHNARDN